MDTISDTINIINYVRCPYCQATGSVRLITRLIAHRQTRVLNVNKYWEIVGWEDLPDDDEVYQDRFVCDRCGHDLCEYIDGLAEYLPEEIRQLLDEPDEPAINAR